MPDTPFGTATSMHWNHSLRQDVTRSSTCLRQHRLCIRRYLFSTLYLQTNSQHTSTQTFNVMRVLSILPCHHTHTCSHPWKLFPEVCNPIICRCCSHSINVQPHQQQNRSKRKHSRRHNKPCHVKFATNSCQHAFVTCAKLSTSHLLLSVSRAP